MVPTTPMVPQRVQTLPRPSLLDPRKSTKIGPDQPHPAQQRVMSAVRRCSSSRPRGTLRCVERCCPSAAQARRSETCSCARTRSMQARRRAGLRSFPVQPPAKTYLKSEHFNGGGSSGPPHVRQMIDSGTSEPTATSIISPSCGLRETSPFPVPPTLSERVDIRIWRACAVKLAASGSDPKFSATSVRSSSCRLTKSSKSPAAASVGSIQLTDERSRLVAINRRHRL
jgi:hypothetical protein